MHGETLKLKKKVY